MLKYFPTKPIVVLTHPNALASEFANILLRVGSN